MVEGNCLIIITCVIRVWPIWNLSACDRGCWSWGRPEDRNTIRIKRKMHMSQCVRHYFLLSSPLPVTSFSLQCLVCLTFLVLFCEEDNNLIKQFSSSSNFFMPLQIFRKKNAKTWRVIVRMQIVFTCKQRFCILLAWCRSNLSLCLLRGFALFAQWPYFRACVIVFEFQLLVSNLCSRLRKPELYPNNKTFQFGSNMHEKLK